jgi:hypothetical protein
MRIGESGKGPQCKFNKQSKEVQIWKLKAGVEREIVEYYCQVDNVPLKWNGDISEEG